MTPLKAALIKSIDALKERFMSEDCDDEAIISNMHRLDILNDKAFREDEFLNYDEAIKELGIGYNRNKLSELTKEYNIKSVTFKNAKIGFRRRDIDRLKIILHER